MHKSIRLSIYSSTHHIHPKKKHVARNPAVASNRRVRTLPVWQPVPLRCCYHVLIEREIVQLVYGSHLQVEQI